MKNRLTTIANLKSFRFSPIYKCKLIIQLLLLPIQNDAIFSEKNYCGKNNGTKEMERNIRFRNRHGK